MAQHPAEYGAQHENLLITVLSLIIIASVALVIWLNVAFKKPCNEHEYVYCGPSATAAPHH